MASIDPLPAEAEVATPGGDARPACRIADLPGPRPWPLLGNAPQMRSAQLHQRLEGWRATYGDVFRVRLGPRPMMVCADPQANAALLRERPHTFRRTRRLEGFSRELGMAGLFAVNGDDWRRQRPMVMAAFDPAHTRAYFASLQRVGARLHRRLAGLAAAGTPFVLQEELMRFTVDVTCGLAFGEDTNTLESDGPDRLQQHLGCVFRALHRRLFSPLPLWRFLAWRDELALPGHLAQIRRAIEGFMARGRARLAADPALRERPQLLIDAMLAARDRPGSGMTDEDVAGNVLTMLLAGEDTTAHTLSWLVWLLHEHPEAFARARAEADAVLGEAPLPERFEQLQGLDWLLACARETMRLKPVAPLILNEVLQPARVAGVAVEPGELVAVLMRPAALDERHFATPHAFRPERWLGAGATAATSSKRVSMPFGAGPRICPGRYLALLEIQLAAAVLVRHFDVVAITTPHGGAPRERMALAMGPEAFTVRLAPRAGAGLTPAAPSCS
jgi:cytochrome P450